MPRVVLAGVAVAGVAATTSAFTAGNDVTGVDASEKGAGYGEVVVTGVTVTDITYNPVSTDGSRLDNVVFTVTAAVATNQSAHLTLEDGTAAVSSYGCDPDVARTAISCNATDLPLFDAFDTVGLTVAHVAGS